jgi:predicted N-formylglutamate amidohydrolase
MSEYGERRGPLHIGIELRQDLRADEARQNDWRVTERATI